MKKSLKIIVFLILSLCFNKSTLFVQQWTFTQLWSWSYINTDNFFPSGTTEFSFKVYYNGTFIHSPEIYTLPPTGHCAWEISPYVKCYLVSTNSFLDISFILKRCSRNAFNITIIRQRSCYVVRNKSETFMVHNLLTRF